MLPLFCQQLGTWNRLSPHCLVFQVSFCQIWALIIDARQLAPIVHKCVTGFLTKREKKGCLFIFIWIHEIRGGRKEKLPKRLKVEVTAAKWWLNKQLFPTKCFHHIQSAKAQRNGIKATTCKYRHALLRNKNSEKYRDSCYKQYAQCAITLNCGLLTFGFFYISSQDSGCLSRWPSQSFTSQSGLWIW